MRVRVRVRVLVLVLVVRVVVQVYVVGKGGMGGGDGICLGYPPVTTEVHPRHCAALMVCVCAYDRIPYI